MRVFNDVVQMIDECKRTIRSLADIDQALYMEPLESIERVLENQGTRTSCARFLQELPPTTFATLKFCEDKLARAVGEAGVNRKELGGLLSDVESLTKKVADSEIPTDIKAKLIDGLEEIRRAIMAYDLLGPERLRKAFETNLGNLLRFYSAARAMEDKEETQETARDFSNILLRLDRMLSVVSRAKPILAPILERLGLGPGAG